MSWLPLFHRVEEPPLSDRHAVSEEDVRHQEALRQLFDFKARLRAIEVRVGVLEQSRRWRNGGQ